MATLHLHKTAGKQFFLSSNQKMLCASLTAVILDVPYDSVLYFFSYYFVLLIASKLSLSYTYFSGFNLEKEKMSDRRNRKSNQAKVCFNCFYFLRFTIKLSVFPGYETSNYSS